MVAMSLRMTITQYDGRVRMVGHTETVTTPDFQ